MKHHPYKPLSLVRTILSAIALATLCTSSYAEEPGTPIPLPAPSHLTCEYQVNPIGLDATAPRLAWRLHANTRGQKQAAYHILVASTQEKLQDNQGDLWNSGRVDSSQSVHVAYQGKRLASGQPCFWKVRVWPAIPTTDAQPSDWSAPASWEMGLLSQNDWKAQWIDDGRDNPSEDADFFKTDPAPLFRKTFQLPDSVRKARLYISGLGYYDARINGQPVGDRLLDPAWTDYDKRVFYSTYDVTDLLQLDPEKDQVHCIAASLGNGWYNPLPLRMWGSRNIREALITGRPRLIAQLVVECNDGTSWTIPTDPSWKVAQGPILRNSIYLGEVYDARKEIAGWTRSDFDDTEWADASPADKPVGPLQSQPLPPIRITQTIQPVNLSEPEPGVFIYDFGQNFGGSIRLHLDVPRDTQVHLRYGELIHPDGTLNPRTSACGQIKGKPVFDDSGRELGVWDPVYPSSAWQGDAYIAKGDGPEVYQPSFTFHAFRYVEVTGLPGKPTLDMLEGLRMNSDVQNAGEFSCSNPTFNQIQDICRWTFKSNIYSVQSDCPHRERFGYGGDLVTTSDTFMLNFDMSNFYQKATVDWQDAALEDGMLTDTAPFVGIQYCGVGWAMAHPLLQQKLYQYYGNRRLIEEQYETSRKWLSLVQAQYPNHIVTSGLSDHESLVPTPSQQLVTPLYCESARILSRLAEILGRTDEAQEYKALAENIAKAWAKEFVQPETGVISPETQAVYAFALFLDMLPEKMQEKATKHLVNDIVNNRDGHLSTGIFGTQFALDQLSRRDHTDLVYSIVNNREFPGWGYMLENGATTLWEHWAFSDNTFSHNHPMFGSVSQWFFNWLGGIQPAADAVGFDRIVLHPQFPDDLDWVRCSYDSIRGPVTCNWNRTESGIRLYVEVPAQSTATITLPAQKPENIEENGKPAADSNGIRLLRTNEDSAVFALDSGNYQFLISAH